MPANQDFANYCCDLLASAGPCVSKRMFGGFGVSIDGLTIAIVGDLGNGEKLWLKADDDTRTRYEAAGCERFTYPMKGVLKSMNYYSAPEEAMDSPDAMQPWARLALSCALRAHAAAPVKKKPIKRAASTVNTAQAAPKLAAKSSVRVKKPRSKPAT